MKDKRKKEIRQILIGFMSDDGYKITAAQSFSRLSKFSVLHTGAFSALLFGVSTRQKQFKSVGPPKEAEQKIRSALYTFGRVVGLSTAPDADAILYHPLLHNPCVLTAELQGNKVLLSFYAARTPLAFLNARRTFSQFKKRIGEGVLKEEKTVTLSAQCRDTPEKNENESGEGKPDSDS